MPINLLTNDRNGGPGSINNIEFDATLSESHKARSSVTNNPTEDGSDITDHIRNNPLSIDIEGFITNSPIDSGLLGSAEDRVQKAFDRIFELRDNKELVDVVSGLKVYERMAITNINVPRNAGTGNSINMRISLARLRLSNFRTLTRPQSQFSAGSIRDQLATPSQIGRQVTSAATDEVESIANSVLGF